MSDAILFMLNPSVIFESIPLPKAVTRWKYEVSDGITFAALMLAPKGPPIESRAEVLERTPSIALRICAVGAKFVAILGTAGNAELNLSSDCILSIAAAVAGTGTAPEFNCGIKFVVEFVAALVTVAAGGIVPEADACAFCLVGITPESAPFLIFAETKGRYR